MSYCRLSLWALSGVCALASVSLAAAETKPLYTNTKVAPIGAPDHWDLLTFDADSHRVYIAHGDRVTVVDVQNGTLIGIVEGYSGGTHGVEVVPGSGHGYTDDGTAGVAGSFDRKTLKPLKTVKADSDADAVIYDPASGHVFVVRGTVPAMRGARTVTVDPSSGRLYLVAADMTINESADPKDYRHRHTVTLGSVKLLFLDPTQAVAANRPSR